MVVRARLGPGALVILHFTMNAPIERLLPHQPPMLLIEAVTAVTENGGKARACFAENAFAVADGKVIESALVECVAQTAGATQAYRARSEAAEAPERPKAVRPDLTRKGMLAAVSNFQFQACAQAGKILEIEVRELKRFGLMLLVAGSVSCEGQAIASGELTLYA